MLIRGVLSSMIRVLLKGTVLSFTGVWIVTWVVLLNIYVISVKAHTRSAVVIFVAKVDPLRTDPSLPSLNLKSPNLPTPIPRDL